MPKHRGHGEGSIFQRKDGRWCAAVTTGRDPKGKLKRRYVYGKTRQDVKDQLVTLLADQQKGLPIDVSKQTVGEFLRRWLEDVARPSLRPKTVDAYERIIRVHLIPTLGSIQITKLTPQHIQHLYRRKWDAGLTHTVRLCHSVLHRSLSQAERWGLIPRNPARVVDRPKIQRKEMQAFDPEDAGRFLDVAQKDRLYALYVAAVTCGLRQGELLGLKWEDVNFDAGTITVRRQLQWLKVKVKTEDGSEKEQTQPTFTEPKSSKSRRTIALPSITIAALKRHKVRQAEERLRLGEVWQDWGLIFTTEIGTPILKGNLIRRSFKPLLEKAGLPDIPFHSLRHTAASLLLGDGESIKTVQEMLGHSSISLTADTYGHIGLTQQKKAAVRMDAILLTAKEKHR